MSGDLQGGASDRHDIVFMGGGPINGVSPVYETELSRLMVWVMSAAEPRAWWSGSSVANLEMWVWYDRDKVTYRTRKSASKLMAQIERSARSTSEAEDPAQLARLDVSKLLEKIAHRMDLDPPPLLP